MLTMERILLATDFSTGAAQAQAYAAFFASAWKAHLDLLHVIPLWPDVDLLGALDRPKFERIREEITRGLDDLGSQLRRVGVKSQTHQDQGIPSERIIAAATTFNANLVVVGSHGRSNLEHILLGSTAERVVKGAPCPVLTVRASHLGAKSQPSREQADDIRIRRILLAFDLSECSLPAVDYAVQLANTFNASVTIIHVMEWRSLGASFTVGDFAEWERLRESIESRLSDMAEQLKSEGVTAQCVLKAGPPADAIVSLVKEQGCDLVVMGTQGRRGMSRLLIGSVAEAVLRRADCPVLTVKEFQRAPGP